MFLALSRLIFHPCIFLVFPLFQCVTQGHYISFKEGTFVENFHVQGEIDEIPGLTAAVRSAAVLSQTSPPRFREQPHGSGELYVRRKNCDSSPTHTQ